MRVVYFIIVLHFTSFDCEKTVLPPAHSSRSWINSGLSWNAFRQSVLLVYITFLLFCMVKCSIVAYDATCPIHAFRINRIQFLKRVQTSTVGLSMIELLLLLKGIDQNVDPLFFYLVVTTVRYYSCSSDSSRKQSMLL